MKRFWEFRNAAGGVGELLLYGDIASSTWYGDEVTPTQFKSDMDALGDVSELRLYINSGGGDAFAGQAIHTMLKRHKAKVTAYIDGLAASAASVVAMAADKIIMPANAMMMIHKAWMPAAGNADDFRELAEFMDKFDQTMVTVYSEKTGHTREQIENWLMKDKWMNAQEALSLGFADEVEKSKKVAASMNGSVLAINGQTVDLARYHYPPVDAIKSLEYSPQADPDNTPPNDEARRSSPGWASWAKLEILAI